MFIVVNVHFQLKKKKKEVMLPPEYTKWKKVFEKKASERFPERRPWDLFFFFFFFLKMKGTFTSMNIQSTLQSTSRRDVLAGFVDDYLIKCTQ